MKKINLTRLDKVQAALDDVEARCSVRTMDAEELVQMVDRFTKEFSCPTKAMVGLEADVQVGFGGKVPSSYNGTPESTYVRIRRYPSGWFVVDVGRRRCPPHGRVTVVRESVTAATIAAIVTHALDRPYRL